MLNRSAIPTRFPEKSIPALLYLFYAGLVFCSLKSPFFWDSVLLSSRYAQWFYDTGFRELFFPAKIDAGYPPVYGMFLAFCWKLFGRSLAVSHLVMLPFVLGIVHQIIRLTQKFLAPNLAPFAALLLLADPTLIAQCTQVAPDVLLVFFYLFCINRILENKRGQLAFVLIFLGMLSPRGTIAVACLFFTDAILWFSKPEKKTFKSILQLGLPYVPATLLVCSWLLLHYLHTGWIGVNPDPNWSWHSGSRLAGFKGILRNIALLIWRLFDFGRVAVWLVLAGTLGAYYLRKQQLPPHTWRLASFFLVPLIIFSLVLLPYTNPVGHRYYLVVYLFVALLVCYLLANLRGKFPRKAAFGFMLVGLLSGPFWVYPDKVAKGWDASLAHVPYFELRRNAIEYLDKTGIPVPEVGSDFPNLYPIGITDLSEDTRSFKSKDLQTDRYILYSNVYNGFTDEELLALQTEWEVVKTWKKGRVRMILYRRK
jgi:hypothetical protein